MRGCSFTSAQYAIIGQAVKEYINKRDLVNINSTTVITSATLKPYAKSIDEIRCGNFWVPVMIKLPLVLDTEQALQETTRGLKALGILDLIGTEAVCQFCMILPFNLARFSFNFLSIKFSFALSSIPGPRSGF